MPLPSLLVFGPQTSWRNPEQLSQFRDILVVEPRLRGFVAAIRNLPELWHDLVKYDSRLGKTSGLDSIEKVSKWVDGEEIPFNSDIQPNTLTTVLTIIVHLTQHLYYIDNDIDYPSQSKVIESVHAGGIQGFCVGLLSAVAVASSRNEEDLNHFGAIALRLALCAGAYVDLDRVLNGDTVFLAVRWRTETSYERVEEILKGFPNAYISVVAGKTDVTVTVENAHVSSLSLELSEEGMTVVPVGLSGRFHSPSKQVAFEQLLGFCKDRPDLSFPSAQQILAPVRSNFTSQPFSDGPLTRQVLQCILCERANWYQTVLAAASNIPQPNGKVVMDLGTTKSIPSSIGKDLGLKVVEGKFWSLSPRGAFGDRFVPSSLKTKPEPARNRSQYGDNAIAVVGMACKFPGADSIDEFWHLLTQGTSMMSEMPEDRFLTKGLRRTPDGKFRFLGNFVRDIQAFDHRFFKKSSREAASMDPQQRLILQCAYEAMESSGHLGHMSRDVKNDIGCFVGVCTNDYNDNVASHNPNAYSSLGTLRAFISGKISHYFGWSGPSITFDTACSSSAVAIHDACRALQLGECSQAVAGGVNLFTTPYFYENLVAASFLSPTGQTKPFDAKADGYCRGEGVGLVVLKKLSTAIADGDNVMGVISGSGINQNSNCVGITVPHSASQAALYIKVADLAGVDRKSVSYVEAHGTGTPVGDPKEIASIREVFGGANRADPLFVSSVKGNIGHLEAASGVASLIKTLLMIKYGTIPVQASFNTLNPSIPPLEPDRVAIPVTTQKWTADFKAACINNYGASGSNATMIICEPPADHTKNRSQITELAWLPKYPIYISANSSTSLAAYCSALRMKALQMPPEIESKEILASMAYNLAVKQNRALPKTLTFAASSLSEFNAQLLAESTEGSAQELDVPAKAKPVVLVFGGQVNDAVGLSKDLYDNSLLLRQYLDQCNVILCSFGLSGLYPEIFQTTPVSDIVALQSMVFSLQYSCSKAWMDSGLKIDAVVGHSLGQLAAMCIAGTLSLEEGLKLVSGRASLMQKHWGDERGSMIAVEGDETLVSRIISTVDEDIEVACYNGPSSHVLVGREASVTKVQQVLADPSFSAGKIKSKRLNVTHGFHSVFTEALLPSLTTLAGELAFKDPVIHLETCSDGESWTRPSAHLIAEHTRTPVYFGQAIERLVKKFGACTWLEAGSSSSVTGMVRRALDPAVTSEHSFESASFATGKALESLSDITINLWNLGHKTQFWSFHQTQKQQYSPIDLPPYQFEKNMHWLQWQEPSGTKVDSIRPAPKPSIDEELLSFVCYSDQKNTQAQFSVNPMHKQWKAHVSGHAVLGEPLCPANLYVELVTRAAMHLSESKESKSFVPLTEALEITTPLGMAQDRLITLNMTQVEKPALSWTFEMSSRVEAKDKPTSHSTGKITLQQQSPALLTEFSRYQKLIPLSRLEALKADPRSEALQGNMVYKMFSKVVDYAPYYKSVRGVFARDGEIAGKVVPATQSEEGLKGMLTSPLVVDGFIQVSGLHINSLSHCEGNQVYVCTKLDRIQVSPHFKVDNPESRAWDIYSNFTRTGDKTVSNDIYVFDSATGELVVVVFGAYFTRVAIASLARVLSQANKTVPNTPISSQKPLVKSVEVASLPAYIPAQPKQIKPKFTLQTEPSEPSITGLEAELRILVHRVTDIPMANLTPEASLEDYGVDSLMVTEIASEVSENFRTEVDAHDLIELPSIKSLAGFLISRGCGDIEDDSTDSESDTETIGDSEDGHGIATPGSLLSVTPRTVSRVSMEPASAVERLKKMVAAIMESNEVISRKTNLADLGLDSLMFMELVSDIKVEFGTNIDAHLFDNDSNFGDLSDIVIQQYQKSISPIIEIPITISPAPALSKNGKVETIVYKEVDSLSLKADIHYPSKNNHTKYSVALLIHGGGHCLYSRSDVSTKQVRLLHTAGFLPISVDYRLCPETTLLEGPMTDVRDALFWIRKIFPFIPHHSPSGLAIDTTRIAVIGWSTGGTLALSLGFTPQQFCMSPPNVILAYYCPSNYDDACFKKPIYPKDSIDSPCSSKNYDLLDSVRDEPIAGYCPPLNKGAPGSFLMSLSDPRWRIILHMNWHSQMVPILVNGLPSKQKLAKLKSSSPSKAQAGEDFNNIPFPSPSEVTKISPFAQIAAGNYSTPTYIMHGTNDDLVPFEQSVKTVELLKRKGVKAGLGTAKGAGHLFDLFSAEDPEGVGKGVVEGGMVFLKEIIKT